MGFLIDDMRISIVIPCYNEEKSIEQSIRSYLTQSRPADEVIIVDDGSADRSVDIISQFGSQVRLIALEKNTGNKSFAQEIGFNAASGDVLIATDADTVLDEHFVREIEKSFQNPSIAAVAGYVKSIKYNWITAARELDYIFGQGVFKTAQSYINYITVIPGAAAAYRAEVFRNRVSFEHDTVTEDLDFTYKLHQHNERIIFNKDAIIYTQDPPTLHSYINQMRRWYGGGWQNLKKHYRTVNSPMRVFELSLIYIEGMLSSLFFFLLPFIYLKAFLVLIAFHVLLSIGLGIYGSIKRKRPDLFYFSPAYSLIALINAYVFIEQFFKEIVFKKTQTTWFSPERRRMVVEST